MYQSCSCTIFLEPAFPDVARRRAGLGRGREVGHRGRRVRRGRSGEGGFPVTVD